MTELSNKRLEYDGLFTDLEIGVVKNVINESRRQWTCLEKEDFDDLLQSCLVKWWKVKNRYDNHSGASLSAYMSSVIRNHLTNLKNNLLSDKRIVAIKTVSLDQPADDDNLPELINRLPTPDFLPTLEIKLSVQVAVSMLSNRQQELCRLLSEDGLRVIEASKSLKVSKVTIYKEIKRIRTIFEKQNLRNCL